MNGIKHLKMCCYQTIISYTASPHPIVVVGFFFPVKEHPVLFLNGQDTSRHHHSASEKERKMISWSTCTCTHEVCDNPQWMCDFIERGIIDSVERMLIFELKNQTNVYNFVSPFQCSFTCNCVIVIIIECLQSNCYFSKARKKKKMFVFNNTYDVIYLPA